MASTVVLSDTHFGHDSSTLASKRRVDYLIWEIWRYCSSCDEVVLLGDIFDLWRSRPEMAIRDGQYLFDRLKELDLKVSYIVGNHDYHLIVMSRESELLESVARGETYCGYIPNLQWSQTINGMEVDMYYPTYVKSHDQRCFLFTHGHHLDGISAFPIQVVEKLRRLAGEEISQADLEQMMAYTYESIYQSSFIGEIVGLEERLWKASTIFEKVRSGLLRTFRYTPVERQYESIMRFIAAQKMQKVDAFLYGDTHRADIFSRKGGPLAVNVGCFTADFEESPQKSEQIPDTYAVVSSEGITLRQVGQKDALKAEIAY